MNDITKKLNLLNPVKTITPAPIEPDLLTDLSFADSDFDFADEPAPINSSVITTNKTPKNALIEFIKTSILEEPYTLIYAGDYDGAKAYIHRMRVELSRFRAQIIKLNKPLNHFHILTKSITIESETLCTITLLKTTQRRRVAPPEVLTDVLDFLTIPE